VVPLGVPYPHLADLERLIPAVNDTWDRCWSSCRLGQTTSYVRDRHNRKGEMFLCIACDHKGDADFVGAGNILTKTLAALGHVLAGGQKMSAHQ
jgi:hypothetical protein